MHPVSAAAHALVRWRRGASALPLILIGAVGGAVTFGLLGLFLGPTLLAVGYELIREWNAAEKHDEQLSFTA